MLSLDTTCIMYYDNCYNYSDIPPMTMLSYNGAAQTHYFIVHTTFLSHEPLLIYTMHACIISCMITCM